MIEFENVTIDVPNKNKKYKKKYIRLVDNACGEVKKGELLAIMGPSGCGKSTLIQALAGRLQSGSHTSGSITYEGKQREARKWIGTIGFADQDDTIFEEATVYQTLYYATKFKLQHLSDKQIDKKIRDLVKKLNITHVYHNKMRKLSGGERKRVMLGVEIIKDVKVLFFDEPTSGLDTKTALQIVKMLRECANDNKIVIITIHQPCLEIFEQFDKLMLMSDTKTLYFGKVSDCEEFLEQKGITRDKKYPISDFLAEVSAVPNDEDERANENAKYSVELAKDFDSLHPKKREISMNKQNTTYRNYTVSAKSVYYLTKRMIQTKFGQPGKIVKKLVVLL